MDQHAGTTSDGLTTARLLTIATKIDASVTARRLEFWRNQGLLPHPRRSGQQGTRPLWTYPRTAEDQLRTLLRLRETTKHPDVLRAALWFDGYEVPTPQARAAITRYLEKIRASVERELRERSPVGVDPVSGRRAVLEDLAESFGRKRPGPFPRAERQRLHDRTRAVALMMGLGLNEPGTSESLNEEGALQIERLLGLTPGRNLRIGDAGPWLSGPAAPGLAFFAEFGSLPVLIETTRSADDAQLETARASGRIFLLGMSFVVRLADAFTGRPNATGATAMVNLAELPEVRIWVTALLTSLGNSPDHAEGAAQVVEALSGLRPIQDQILAIAAMPEAERATLLKGLPSLPYITQAAIKRVITEFRPAEE